MGSLRRRGCMFILWRCRALQGVDLCVKVRSYCCGDLRIFKPANLIMQKLSVLFLSLVVVFLFFAGFYLYYVPANKAVLNKYGFLVLQQMEASMQYKVKANENLFSNYV